MLNVALLQGTSSSIGNRPAGQGEQQLSFRNRVVSDKVSEADQMPVFLSDISADSQVRSLAMCTSQ